MECIGYSTMIGLSVLTSPRHTVLVAHAAIAETPDRIAPLHIIMTRLVPYMEMTWSLARRARQGIPVEHQNADGPCNFTTAWPIRSSSKVYGTILVRRCATTWLSVRRDLPSMPTGHQIFRRRFNSSTTRPIRSTPNSIVPPWHVGFRWFEFIKCIGRGLVKWVYLCIL